MRSPRVPPVCRTLSKLSPRRRQNREDYVVPSVLFADRLCQRPGSHQQYDVAPDGQRFIMVRPVHAGSPSRLILVRNALSNVEIRREQMTTAKSRPGGWLV